MSIKVNIWLTVESQISCVEVGFPIAIEDKHPFVCSFNSVVGCASD